MHELPTKARIFVLSVWLTGLISAAAASVFTGPQVEAPLFELSLLLILGVVAGRTKIKLIRRKNEDGKQEDDTGSMSLGFALVFATMLRFGPAAAVIVGATSTLFGCLYPKRQPAYQLLFNVALNVTETFLAGLVFLYLNQNTLELNGIRCFPAVVAASLSFFAINTGAVATIIALCSGQRVSAVWKESFLWTAPSYFAGACVSTLALVILGRHVAAVLLFTSPVAYLTYYSYFIYTARAEEKQQHIEELQMSQEQLADLYLATIKSLALAIDAKDQYTHQHILRVQRYAVATATHLGITGPELEGINTGALLHDIGKLGVPEYILLKPGKLTPEEREKINKHPEIGADILSPVEFPWPVLPAVKYHHEKWDGTGYPEGLAGEAIPLPGRILAVADVYDAVTSNRSYRGAWTHEKAMHMIREGAGTQFDPAIVDAFVQIIDGVVEELAREGQGPLALSSAAAAAKVSTSKSEQAAWQIQRASSELWALYEVAQTLSSSLGLQETLDILARKLEAILPGTGCLFLLKEEGTGRLSARAAVGVNQPYFAGSGTVGGASRSIQVAHERQTYLGPYEMDDLLLTSSPTTPWEDLQAALIVPIVHQGEVLGTINLYHPQRDAFGAHDQQLLEMIAERAAMALYNGILYDRTRSRASTDPLTGLFNVRYLTEYVDERCQRAAARAADGAAGDGAGDGATPRSGDRFALLCLDLDSFKPINDLFGHQKGDQVLRDLSGIFGGAVRQPDVVARYGGDEFLIVLDGANADEAASVADKLHKAVTTYDPGLVHPKLGALRLGVSIGIGCFPEDGNDCGTLLSIADSKMYRGKAERKLGQLVERAPYLELRDYGAAPAEAPGTAPENAPDELRAA